MHLGGSTMTGERGANAAPPTRSDEELDPRLDDPLVRAWFEEHLPELRRNVAGHRLLYGSLALALIIGLVAHVAGYLLKSNTTTEPLALVADLLYALGYALWTGAVVVAFTQVLPETKRRQIERAIDNYEAGQRDETDKTVRGTTT
jgi:hypothetical protein